MGKDILQPPRGIRDIVGEEAEALEYLMDSFREIARLHGFKPIIPPTIEYSKLFEAKSGEEIRKTMYVFTDKGGRVVALRPEVTASVVRIYLRKLRGEAKPLRLYYIAQCFRYEEPQHARYREFWQAGLEIIGEKDINGDLSVAFTASYYLDHVGVKHYYVVGNVAFHRMFLSHVGLNNEDQDHVLHLIDKDMVDDALKYIAERVGENGAEVYERLINTPLDKLVDLMNEYSGFLGNDLAWFRDELDKTMLFIDSLRELGYEAYYEPKLARGLAYYSGLIYEYKALESGVRVSIGGGGRYDNLTTIYGGSPEYSTGLALGLDRVALTLAGGEFSKKRGEVLIISLTRIPLKYPYTILKMLVDNDIPAWIYRTDSIGKGLSLANKKNIDKAIILGEKEYSENKATFKDLIKGEQYTVSLNELIDVLKKH